MNKFIALLMGALLHVSVPAFADEACNIEPMDGIPAQVEQIGAAYRPLTAIEVKLVVEGLPVNNADGEEFDSGFIVVSQDGSGAIVLGRGGFSCGMVLLPPQGVKAVIKIIMGVGA